jgi:aminopeptidase
VIEPAGFAALLCDYCLEVQPGQQVVVRSTTLASPLLLSLQRALLAREAWPLMRVSLPGQEEGFWGAARDVHLDGFAGLDLLEAERTDASVMIHAPENTRALAGVEPSLLSRAARARAPVREAALARRWCVSVWPTPALAQDAGMSVADFATFVARALFLDRPDPVAAWGELRASQARLIERLAAASELRIEGEGTDVSLGVAGRTWINSDGRRNMPSGEVFTGPVENSASGVVRFGVPSSPRGVRVTGVSLEFRDGVVVDARADQGDDVLQAMLATDDGARRLGEIGIGTNFGIDRAVGLTLLDEKIGGTVHLALGRSYPETGGTNESAMNEGLGKVLRFGAYDDEVLTRLRWLASTLGPTLEAAIKHHGPVDLRMLIAQALQMGDECHNRNAAATSLFARRLASSIVRTAPADVAAQALDFLAQNDHFFLNLSMAACKATMDAAHGIEGSTVVTAMARNGVEFGIRVSGTGGAWFTAPATVPNGLYFPGYGPNDANPDLGDSAITETRGIGGFAMAAAPAIVRFVGGTSEDALGYTREMQRITLAQDADFALPPLGFVGTPTAIDLRRVVESGTTPVINTGIAHKEPGVGQIGAGIARAPLACFADALREVGRRLNVGGPS